MLDTRYLYSSPFWFAESILVFIPTFILIHFLFREKIPNKYYLVLIPASIFIGYSSRPEITMFFVPLLFSSLLFTEKIHRIHLKKLSLASILGLLISCFYVYLERSFVTFPFDVLLIISLIGLATVVFLITG